MAIFGKSIRIYLKDGTVSGIRFGEVVNQTIQAIACPRNRLPELRPSPEANRPGVYFLFGNDEITGDNMAYIGEAENVFERLQSHYKTKDFWNEVIFFVNKDENLTKSHVKHLESRIIQLATSTKRYKIDNDNKSQASALPPADRDAMEEFLVYLKLLLGVLGHKLLEELNPIKLKSIDDLNSNKLTDTSDENQTIGSSKTLELFLSASGVNARAIQTDEGIVVLEGSEVVKNTSSSLHKGYEKIRENLIDNATLKLIDDKYIFQKSFLFDSASAAGQIIVGRSISGPQAWKDKNGITLKDIEEHKIIQSMELG
jgi:hypothetical protein